MAGFLARKHNQVPCKSHHGTLPEATTHQTADHAGVMDELTNTEELGNRGELLFAGQVAQILLVFVSPVDLGILSRLLGLVGAAGGLAICAAGAKSLGKNLTPLPAPRTGGGSLVKNGMYKCATLAINTAAVCVDCVAECAVHV